MTDPAFDSHARRAWQCGIKLPHIVAFVLQSQIHDLSRCGVQHRQRLLASVQIASYAGNLKLAQKLLGHSSIDRTADVYTHTSPEAEREAAIAIERAIYGDLFPVVPDAENRNNSAAIN